MCVHVHDLTGYISLMELGTTFVNKIDPIHAQQAPVMVSCSDPTTQTSELTSRSPWSIASMEDQVMPKSFSVSDFKKINR